MSSRRHLDLCSAVIAMRLVGLCDEAERLQVMPPADVARVVPQLVAATAELASRGAGVDASHGPDDLRRLVEELRASADAPLPLARLADFGGALAVDVVVAAALVERDVRVGAAVATLQGLSSSRRPCLGLLARLLGADAYELAQVVAGLVANGLIVVDNPDEPRPDQTVRLTSAVQLILDGAAPPGVHLFEPGDAPPLDELVLPEAVRDRVARAADLLAGDHLDALVVRGAPGTGRRTALRAVAGRLGRGLLVADTTTAAASRPPVEVHAVAVLTGAMLAWTTEPGLGQVSELARPPSGTPVGVVTGRRGAVRVDGAERVAVLDLPMPGPEARRRFWALAGLQADEEVTATVSERFVLSGGTIRKVAAHADAIARLDGRTHPVVDDIRRASQEQGRQQLESLASLLPPLPEGFAPVLAGAAAEEFETLVRRSRHREMLPSAVGGAAGDQITRGVRALLSGPSGTGKTLSARALGARLGLDVYRADLAALVDKYIGETERRLDELLSRSEQLDVVLLIDEGDALMTRRTDVRSSNDRYANLETDYLLQRLEAYEGIVLITTNAPQLVDSAFHRRIDVTISFSPPGSAERLEIWRRHLPQRHSVTPATLDRVAHMCRLTGGQISNAAVHAAMLALDARRLVDDACLVAAVERELAMAGKTSPFENGAAAVSSWERAVLQP